MSDSAADQKINSLDDKIREILHEYEPDSIAAGWVLLVDTINPVTEERSLYPVVSPAMSKWTYLGMLLESQELWPTADDNDEEED